MKPYYSLETKSVACPDFPAGLETALLCVITTEYEQKGGKRGPDCGQFSRA